MADVTVTTALRGVEEVLRGFQQMETSVEQVQTAAVALGSTIGTLAGQAIVHWAGQIKAAVEESLTSFANLGEQIERIKATTGLGSRAITELQYAAKSTGVAVESLTVGFRTFAREADLASQGNKKAAADFERLGVSLHETSGALKSSEKLYLDSIAALGKMAEGYERTAIASRVFGQASRSALAISGDFEKLRAVAAQLGLVMDETTARAAAKLDDQLDKLSGRAEGLSRAFASSVAPALTDFLTILDNTARTSERANAALLTFARTLSFIPGFGIAAKQALSDLDNAMKRFASGKIVEKDTLGIDEAIKTIDELSKKAAEFWMTPGQKQAAGFREIIAQLEALEKKFPGLSDKISPLIDKYLQMELAARQTRVEVEKLVNTEAGRSAQLSRLNQQLEKELKAINEEQKKAADMQKFEEQWREKSVASLDRMNTGMAEQVKHYEDLADPIGAYARGLDKINTLQVEYGMSAEAATVATKKLGDQIFGTKEKNDDFAKAVAANTESAFSRLIFTSASLSDKLKALGADFAELFYKMTIGKTIALELEKALKSVSEAGGVRNWLGGLLGGGGGGAAVPAASPGMMEMAPVVGMFQHGGFLPAGFSGMVGEAGPERIDSTRRGTRVTPLGGGRLGGDNYNFSYTFNAGVTRAELASVLPQIRASTIAGVADARRRGGKFSSVF